MSREKHITIRVINEANLMIERGLTVRAIAKISSVSKSTVHKDLSERLPEISAILYTRVSEIMLKHKQEKHIRGGLATKQKYLIMKQQQSS